MLDITETSFIREICVIRVIRDSDKQGTGRTEDKHAAPTGMRKGCAEHVFYKHAAPMGLRFWFIDVFCDKKTVRYNKRAREPRPYEDWKL